MLYMFLAEGFEETEAIGALDVIRRAEIEIRTVGVTGKTVTGSHGVEIVADILPEEKDYSSMEGVILPGGMPGTTNLFEDERVVLAVKSCFETNRLIAAICAAPMIFGQLGLLRGKKATCYPGFEKYLEGAEVVDASCTADGNVICGRGAGAAMLFGAEIVNFFKKGEGEKILAQMQHPMC